MNEVTRTHLASELKEVIHHPLSCIFFSVCHFLPVKKAHHSSQIRG
jgi:hypothetical protein